MGKIVVATLGSLGDIHPCMGVARELQSRGHEVRFATSPYYADYITNAGFKFYPVRPDFQPNDKELLRVVLDPYRGAEKLHKRYIFPVIRETTADIVAAAEGADLLFTSILCYGAPIASKLAGIPWVSGLLSPLAMFSGHDPSLISALPWLGKMRFLSPATHRWITRMLFKVSDGWAKQVHEYKREVGVEDNNVFFDGYFSPYRTLCLWSDPFGPPQVDWPASARTTGFVFYDPKENDPLSDSVERFLESGEKPIVMTLGSTAVEDGARFIELFEKTALLLNKRVIITTGARALPEYQSRSSKNILFIDYAPYEKLFSRAQLVVHQGGVGTTAQGLRAGVPTIILPFGMDQPDNAWRVVRGKWGASLPRRRATPKRLAALIENLLHNAEVKSRCEAIGTRIKSENGSLEAAKQLEQMLR